MLKKTDTCKGDTDKRYTYVIDTDRGEHIAVKFAGNSFTTPERISAWKQLGELYNRIGIYSPRIICDKYGCIYSEYLEDGVNYIVYAEEKAVYKFPEELGLGTHDNSCYFEDMVRTAAQAALHSTQLPGWKTAWCIYDKFAPDDESDETYYWHNEFYELVIKEMPGFRERAERIWRRFKNLYESFEAQYRALPQAFFQGDINNVLLDENKKFVGIYDYNLAGAETVLNYLFREFCRVPIHKNEIDQLNDRELLEIKDREMRTRLDTVKKYYPFNRAEILAFPTYYKIVYPLECDNCQRFLNVIREGNPDRTERILDWIEYQQTRNDIFSSVLRLQ